jgi:hypothetical protein
VTGIPPICRNNSDYVLCGQINRASLQMLCDEFQGGEVSKEKFLELYRRATRDYGFFVVNCNSVKDGGNIHSIYGVARCPKTLV